MKRKVIFLAAVLLVLGAALFAQEAAAAEAPAGNSSVWKYFAAALAVGISCIAGGIAVGQIGSAAMGAMSENADLSGKALPYAGLAEGICLWGFLVALLIMIL
ncbi:MAG: ATP synthase subunit C [Treponema sp.]|jgi:V/A-type H+-transporting ATPase subunit K|nr:ATP synthase subunit C [Treponema sp.]MDR1176653.1 ATP synthase subunit C [Treponema sp.]MDR2607327.1 ATP synthase subunit C [Treponema sp.]